MIPDSASAEISQRQRISRDGLAISASILGSLIPFHAAYVVLTTGSGKGLILVLLESFILCPIAVLLAFAVILRHPSSVVRYAQIVMIAINTLAFMTACYTMVPF